MIALGLAEFQEWIAALVVAVVLLAMIVSFRMASASQRRRADRLRLEKDLRGRGA